jgi:hypothetical protein
MAKAKPAVVEEEVVESPVVEEATVAEETPVVEETATEEVTTKKGKKVVYPEIITFELHHPVMEFDQDPEIDHPLKKDIIDTLHKKKDENGDVVMQTRSFSANVHGENYVEIAREFLATNSGAKQVIKSHNFPL